MSTVSPLLSNLSSKGPIMHINAFGQPLIILNTHNAAADLLERRAAIYSDRPDNIVAVEMMTGGMYFPFAGTTSTDL